MFWKNILYSYRKLMKNLCIILLFGIYTNSYSQQTDHSSTIIVGDNGVKEYETPSVVHLGLVNPDLLLLKIRAQYVEHGRLTPYLKKKDDEIKISRQHRFIIRNGEAIVMSTFSGAGANPLNTTYVTGIGHRWPQHPLHEDALVSNQPLFAGVTLGGPLDPLSKKKKNASRYEPYQYPDFSEWPVTEHFLDVVSYIPMNEFTVHQTMLPTSFVWGYLAGSGR
jgi:hypothetical protein